MFKNRMLVYFTFVVILTSFSFAKQNNAKITLSVDHSGEDSVGVRLAFALREAIRSSAGYELVSEKALLRVSLITLDTDPGPQMKGYATAASALFTMRNDVPLIKGNPQTWYPIFLDARIFLCGSNRVEDIAKRILAYLDQTYEEFLAAARR
jgi:hypothetical protein